MNSIVQCLAHTSQFSEFCLKLELDFRDQENNFKLDDMKTVLDSETSGSSTGKNEDTNNIVSQLNIGLEGQHVNKSDVKLNNESTEPDHGNAINTEDQYKILERAVHDKEIEAQPCVECASTKNDDSNNDSLLKTLCRLSKTLLNENLGTPHISPYELKRKMKINLPQFSDGCQHDAQEFLRCLLDGLIEEEAEILHGEEEEYKEGRMLLHNLFSGRLCNTLECMMCHQVSVSHEPFRDISISIPKGQKKTTLQDCLSLFTLMEYMKEPNSPFCSYCKQNTGSMKQLKIDICPTILVIHIKRFAMSGTTRYKLRAPVEYSEQIDLSSFVTEYANVGAYNLFAIVEHWGSISRGHYVARIKNRNSNQWLLYDDESVTVAETIQCQDAYLLFYEKAE